MVEVETKVGPKGQILVPKLLREEFNILPGDFVILKETERGLLIEKSTENPIRKMEDIAKKYGKKGIKIDPHKAYEEELEEKWSKLKNRVKK